MTEIDITPMLKDGMSIGAILCGERFTIGKSIEDVSNELKIKPEFIEAIEANTISEVGRPDMAAGLIRTYSKYLGFDPKSVVAEFKREHNLKGPADTFQINQAKASTVSARKASGAGLSSRSIDFKTPPKSNAMMDGAGAAVGGLIALLPFVVGIGLVGAAGYYGYQMLTGSGEVEVAEAVETQAPAPVTSSAEAVDLTAIASVDADVPRIDYEQLYARQASSSPAVSPQDGPIAQTLVDSLATEVEGADTSIGQSVTASTDETDPAAAVPTTGLQLLPLGEAWVQIRTESGSTIHEALLKPGEFIDVPVDGEAKLLKAGNATELYVRVNGKVFGPIGQGGNSVIKDMPMSAEEIVKTLPEVSPARLEELQEVQGAFVALLDVQ